MAWKARLGLRPFFSILLLLFLLLPALGFGQTYMFMRGGHNEDLRILVSFEKDPLPPPIEEFSSDWEAPPSQAATEGTWKEARSLEILKQAQYFLSGMIFGYSFDYVPGDRLRGVSERFDMLPLRQIPWGAGGLSIEVFSQDVAGGQYVFRYTMEAFERNLRQAWQSVATPDSSGSGSAEIIGTDNPIIQALQDACREAIRQHARGLTGDKPASVSGSFILAQAPGIRVDSGRYVADVKVQLRIDRIRHYMF